MIPLLAVFLTALSAVGPVCPAPSFMEAREEVLDTLPELYEGVGEGSHSQLRFFFEVTFMKIDIAWIEAYLDSSTTAVVGRAVASGGYSKRRARALEMALLDGDPMLLRMELARGGSAGRFIGATRDNLEAAVECGAMSQATFDELWPVLEDLLKPVDERGMEKGDAIFYRVEGPGIRIVYLGPGGEIIVDAVYEGREAARGLVGSFICRETKASAGLPRTVNSEDTRVQEGIYARRDSNP